jgi:hypothetical protein
MVEALGIEAREIVRLAENRVDSRQDESARTDVSARSDVHVGPSAPRAVTAEDALARALALAAEAGRWDVVAQLARELEARRLAGASNVVRLDTSRGNGGAK